MVIEDKNRTVFFCIRSSYYGRLHLTQHHVLQEGCHAERDADAAGCEERKRRQAAKEKRHEAGLCKWRQDIKFEEGAAVREQLQDKVALTPDFSPIKAF